MFIRKLFFTISLFIASFVQAQCFYTSPVTYTNNACLAQYPFISYIQYSGFSNTTGCTGSYADYTGDPALKPTVYRGTSSTMLVSANFYSGNNTSQNMVVFIDWNGNNTFDENEFTDLGTAYSGSYTSKTIEVPADAMVGEVRMRLRSAFYDQSIYSTDLCKTLDFGETEDYKIIVAETNMEVSYTAMQPVLPYSFIQQGASDAPVLRIDASGNGTLMPRRLEKLYFHLPYGVVLSDIKTAKLYFTASVDTFNTDSLITTISVTDDTFEIAGLTDTLSGGKNYYWLAFDVATSAKIDNWIDVINDSAVFSGVTHFPSQNDPYGWLQVDYCRPESIEACNYFIESLSIAGINTSPGCTSAGYYRDPYQYGDIEESGTFFCSVKANRNSDVAFLFDFNDDGDFNDEKEFIKVSVSAGVDYEFDLKVPDSVATFFRARLFSAASITSPSDACNAENVYDFDVYGYEGHPMTMEGIYVGGVEQKLVSPGKTNVAVISVNLETYATLSPLTLNEIKFSTKGTTDISHISNAKLWYSKGNPDFNKDKAVLLGTIPVLTKEFSFTPNKALYPNQNYFWLTYDVLSTATDGEKLDATCEGVKIDGEMQDVGNYDPSGYVQVSDTMWMKSATIAQCRTLLYDDGGPDGNYSATSYTLTLTTVPGRYFEIRFPKFKLANNGDPDNISLYEGNVPAQGNLLASYDQENQPGATVVTTYDSVLTIQFEAYSANNGEEGYELEILCKYKCGDNPPSVSYSLSEPACFGGIQKLTTDAGPPYVKPLTYKFVASGVAFNYDSVKVVDGLQDDTSFYVTAQYIYNQYYTLYLIDSNECQAHVSVSPTTLSPAPFDLNATIDDACPYDSSGSVLLNPQGNTGTTTYEWKGAYNTTSQNIPNAPTGFYNVHVVADNGCKDTSFYVYAYPDRIERPKGITGPTDLGSNPGPQRYEFPELPIEDGGEGDQSAFRTTPQITTDFVYSVSLAPASAGSVVVDSTGATINWSESFGGEAKLYLRYQHVYTGCYGLYSLPFIINIENLVDPEKAEAAEGFSPNGDGKNDFFVIRNLSETTNTFTVYNREGMIMYRKENYANEWDGTLNGDGKTAIAEGTYYWVLKNIEGVDLFKGFLELRR